MRFVATGRYRGERARVEWEDGQITEADPEGIVFEVEVLVRIGAEVKLPTYAPGRATLSDPVLAEATIAEVIDDFRVVEGDELPARYHLPPGAVGAAVGHYEPEHP